MEGHTGAYNPPQAERATGQLIALFDRTIRRG
jgi:hypothetical protein